MTFLTRRKFIAIAATLALGHGLPASAAATDWPTAPIRFIVPSSAGGGADTVARLLAQHVGNALKKSIVVENRPGGSGVIGSNALLSAPADGHTFMLGFTTMSQLPATTSVKLPYQTDRDFIPVSLVARSSNVLMTSRSNVDAHSVKKLVEELKAHPEKYSYGSYGNGSTGHFLGAQFNRQTATNAQHIPYKGAAPMMVDLLGGVVAFAFPDIGSALPHLGSDRVRALAVTGEKRMASLPEIPTMQELGYSGFNLGAWFGLFAAKNVPDHIVQAMAKQIADAVADPEVQAKLVGMNLDPVGSDSKFFAEFFSRDLTLWADLADKADIRTE